MKLTKKLAEQWHKLLRLEDSPRAVALGVALGVFFGFTPLFGFKTLLAIGLTWALRGSIVAAVVGVSLHDVVIPLMPIFFRWEYDVGFWLLSRPHQWPPSMHLPQQLDWDVWLNWSTFLNVGRPLLLGSVLLSTPPAILAYFVMHEIMARARRKALASDPTTNTRPKSP